MLTHSMCPGCCPHGEKPRPIESIPMETLASVPRYCGSALSGLLGLRHQLVAWFVSLIAAVLFPGVTFVVAATIGGLYVAARPEYSKAVQKFMMISVLAGSLSSLYTLLAAVAIGEASDSMKTEPTWATAWPISLIMALAFLSIFFLLGCLARHKP